jgi:hypothetical protein
MDPHQDRSQMECGWARQRERFPSTSVAIRLTYRMSTAEYATWSQRVEANAYEWFTTDLDDFNGLLETRDIRFIGPRQYSYSTHDDINVSVDGEFFDGDA